MYDLSLNDNKQMFLQNNILMINFIFKWHFYLLVKDKISPSMKIIMYLLMFI